MAKTAVIYWSTTGNTKQMAELIAEGVKTQGKDVDVFSAAEFSPDKVSAYTNFAFGCPAMGMEQLDDTEFEPMFNGIKGALKGKNIALFGSYGWGDGQWMRNWEEDCTASGISPILESVIVSGEPLGDVVDKCKELGANLAKLG